MKNHTDLINLIAKQIQAKTYLEIGVYNPANNFNKIEVPFKVSVDPDAGAGAHVKLASDDFFSVAIATNQTFDLIFIDGLHHADQVKRDIINSWKVLKTGGVIVIHDCNPHSEHITHVPRDNKEWTGDVYKTVCDITSPKITVDFDYGCCILRKERKTLHFANLDYTWQQFTENRKENLKLVSVSEAVEIIEAWT